MYRAISVAHRDRHLSVIFAPQIYNKLLVTTKNFCRKSAKYVVKHILDNVFTIEDDFFHLH